MTKKVKVLFAVLVCIVYYLIFSLILGIDWGDVWDKMMKWAKKDTANPDYQGHF